jgi:sugar-phosphatase
MTEISCNAILFDMDGTLVDSTECVVRQWRLWTERHGLDFERVLRVSHGRPTSETIREVAPHLATEPEFRAFERAEMEDRSGVKEVAGARPFLRSVPQGRWAVVTSASAALARVRLECAGLPVPGVLVSADRIERGKPDPEGFLLAARLLRAAPERCLVIEDSPAGIQAGRAAGMLVLGMTTTFARADLGCDSCVSDFRGMSLVLDSNGSLRVRGPR